MSSQKKILLLFGILILFILTIPITIILLQQQHETRSRASNESTIPALVCGTNPLDIMLIIDISGSMNDRIDASGLTKIQAAKTAAQNFVDIIAKANGTNDRIGLVTFATTSTLNSKLTTDFAALKSQIGALSANGNTCHQCAARTTNQEIHTNGRLGAKKVAILLTDGIANTIIGHNGQVPPAVAEQAAITEIMSGFNTDATGYYTIGLGTDVNAAFLQKIATDTNAQYYFSPTTAQLNAIYQKLSQILGKGTITGTVFNDLNNNGASDSGEPSLPGWMIQLKVGTPSATPLATTQSDGAGNYSFAGLCDGTYYVNQVLQTGWTQTVPTNPDYYTIAVTKGSLSSKNIFGNAKRACGTSCSTDTSCSGATNSCTSCINKTCQVNYCGKTCTTNTDCGSQGSNCGFCDVNGTKKCVAALSPTATPTVTPTQTPTPTVTSTPTPTQINYCGKTCTTDTDCQSSGSTCQVCDVNGSHKCVASISPTPTPGAMSLGLEVLLHGIGNSGDNATIAASLSNKNPLHQGRSVHVFAYDLNNQLVVDKIGSVSFASDSGSFKGTLDLGTTIPTGKYYIKIQSDYHLRRLVPGLQSLTEGTINIIPSVSLVAGDADNDNALTLLDYNMLIGCYSVLQPARSCTDQEKLATDFNDDGNVDGTDYNLFIRELSVQNGE